LIDNPDLGQYCGSKTISLFYSFAGDVAGEVQMQLALLQRSVPAVA